MMMKSPHALLVAVVALGLSLQDVTGGSLRTNNGSLLDDTRRLSQEYFLTYEPYTSVTDHAAIDLDQKAIEEQLSLLTDQGRQNALNIYTQGAFSNSYAELILGSPLQIDVGIGVIVVGRTTAGEEVRGFLLSPVKTGDTVLQIHYAVSSVQEVWTNCHVGGNPNPNTDGCFAASGSIEIGEIGEYTYSYNPLQSNFNARTLQGFSTQARQTMYDCPQCPYRVYEEFYNYYGVFDYANQWVLAAFNKGSTNFARGNANFASLGMLAYNEPIKIGLAYMNLWMYVIRELEDAIDDCNAGCDFDECNDEQVWAWDEAVAFYTGSIPKISGHGGHLLYTLAQKRCHDFGTCLNEGAWAGMAQVNRDVFSNFQEGQLHLLAGSCEDAERNVIGITQQMTVPLIQSTLKFAYRMDRNNIIRESDRAEGATFAATVLPLLHSCNSDDADIVYDNMRIGDEGGTRFEAVKGAFERNYACMGVTCEEIGGLVADTFNGNYLEGAEPCVQIEGGVPSTQNSTDTNTNITTSIARNGLQ